MDKPLFYKGRWRGIFWYKGFQYVEASPTLFVPIQSMDHLHPYFDAPSSQT